MKTFYFEELLLLSRKEKAARRIKFHPTSTILTGTNQVGKSRVTKGLFWGCGAEPPLNDIWVNSRPTAVVKLVVDDQPVTIVRQDNTFVVHDRGRRRFDSVGEMSAYMVELFDFGLQMPDHQGAFHPLPPAFLLLPFYIDQDEGWTGPWRGFQRLQMIPKFKDKGLVEYHAGIHNNAYYQAQAAMVTAKGKLEKVNGRLEQLSTTYKDLAEEMDTGDFEVDIQQFKVEVDELLKWCDSLKTKEQDFKDRVARLRGKESSLRVQLAVTEEAVKQARADFASITNAGDVVACPVCGTEHQNTIAERFGIALDYGACVDSATEIREALRSVRRDLRKANTEATETTAERENIDRLLARRQGQVKLIDVVRSQGRRQLREAMKVKLDKVEAEGTAELARIEAAKRVQKTLNVKKRRQQVLSFFFDRMRECTQEIDVHVLSQESLRDLKGPSDADGSERIRALIAYKIAFLHTVREFAGPTRFPIVVDSPNQQDQDPDHLAAILKLLSRRRPRDSQLVLALTDTRGTAFEGTTIAFDVKYKVLRESEFESVRDEVDALIA